MNESDYIQNSLNKKKNQNFSSLPIFFSLARSDERHSLALLLQKEEIIHVIDDYKEQLTELFAINNPSLVYTDEYSSKLTEYLKSSELSPEWIEQGIWVYFPWRSSLCHILEKKDFLRVRTARNKLLITEEEQKNFSEATVGIAGLSVGSNIAFALSLQGGPSHIKLADMDRLSLTNTNRVLAGVENLGLLKVEMVARKLYEINPYLHIELFPDGLNKNNIENFFDGLDIVVDELDNLAVKYLIRENAQKRRIPVLMGADNGDNAVVDIERYDLDQNTPFFHDRLGDITYAQLAGLDKFGIGKTITKHIGPENISPRMQESLLQMGKSIVSWPQLGGAALLNGVALAYCIRKILNKQEVPSDRALLILDKELNPSYNSSEEVQARSKASETFKNIFKL